jgi:hypothetical protein
MDEEEAWEDQMPIAEIAFKSEDYRECLKAFA